MAIQLDPRSLEIYDCPPEWPTIPRELIERLIPAPPVPIRDPFGRLHYFQPIPMYTPEQKAQIDAIAASRWFLIKLHESAVCGRCDGKHGYVTLGCVERPWNGITDITQAIIGRPWESFGLSRRERREVKPGESIQVNWNAVRLGDIVPITSTKARVLREKIRMKRYVI